MFRGLPSRSIILCSTALVAALAPAPRAAAQDATVLDTITVFEGFWARFTSIATGAPADTGTTAIGAESVVIRGDGSGDANAALTSLPTVQVEGGSSVDAGQNGDDVLDLRPKELSISGGRTSDNTVLVNGMAVGSLTGNEDPFGADPLSREDGMPNINTVYGLHSQTQFIPESFVDRVTVIDSNASAQYGGFQGGVVSYELAKPSRKASGKAEFSFQNDSMTEYHLATPDGDNPNGEAKPDWNKTNASIVLTQPVGERSAMVFGLSTRQATARKQMDPQYVAREVESDSRANMLMLGFSHDLLNGDSFYIGGTYSDYRQDWTSDWAENMEIDQTNRGLALQGRYERALGDRAIAGVGLRNMKFTLDASVQANRTENLASSKTFYNWYGSYTSTGYMTDAFSGWCDSTVALSGTGVPCRSGGIGDRTYKDQRGRIEAKLDGDVWAGTFRLGAAIERQQARREGEGYVYNSATTRLASGTVTCPAGADDCIDTQYFSTRIVQDPYKVKVSANRFESFLETEQKWGAFGLRAGLRADYNSYLDNLDIAPRLAGTWEGRPGLTFVAGANRYYSDEYMTYAIHDAVPRGLNQRRTATGGVVGDWETRTDLGSYSYAQGNLKTPYTDELTLSATWAEDWTGGTWRARYIDRKGRDQFAGKEGDTSTQNVLTNEGSSRYRAFAMEYDKVWAASGGGALDFVGLNLSAIVADRSVSQNSYFGSSGETPEQFIWYDNKSYTLGEFGKETGNLDIPVKAGVELRGSWKDGAYKAGISADVTFAYDGARDTGEEATRTNPVWGNQTHYLFEPYRFDTVATLNLSASARIGEVAGNAVDLTVRVANLLDETGNRSSTDSNPWVPGRSFWIGTSVTW